MFNTDSFKNSVLDRAMKGKLTKQLPDDGNVNDLLDAIRQEKKSLIKAKKIKRSKPLPDITPDEIPFDIPKNWKWVRLDDITEINIGKTPERSKYEYWNGTIPWISIKDMNSKYIDSTNEKITSLAARTKFKDNIVPKGSLIMSFKLSIGKTSILRVPAYHNEAIVSFKFMKYENPIKNFLFQFIGYLTKFAKSNSAVKGKTLNKSSIQNMLIPFPPIKEQKRIVENVSKCFKLEECIKKEQMLNQNFNINMKKSLLQSAMMGKLTKQLPDDGNVDDLLDTIRQEKEDLIKAKKIKNSKPLPDITPDEIPFDIPKNWKWVRLGDITEISTGNTPNKGNELYYNSNDVEFVKPGDLNGKCITSAKEYISNSALKTSRVANKNSIFVVGIGGSIGKIGINKLNCAFNQQLHNINPICVNYTFIYYTMMSNIIKTQFQNKSGTATPIVNKSKLRSFILPLPPLPEQKRIVEKLDKLFKELNN